MSSKSKPQRWLNLEDSLKQIHNSSNELNLL